MLRKPHCVWNNTSRQKLSVEAGQEVGQASLWEDGAQQGEVDAREDDVSKRC